MNKPRVIRWVALLAGFFLVSLFALALLLPMILDSEAVKAKARAFVAERTNGLVRIEKIELFWFPRPGVVIRNAAIAFDKEIQGKVQQLRLYPSIPRLLTGNLVFSSVTADGAAGSVRLPALTDEPFNVAEAEAKLRAAVKALVLGFPGTNLRIHGGVADIEIAGGRAVMISDIEANLDVTLEKVDFTVSAGSNFADRIRLGGVLATSNLVSEARLSVENLGLRKAFDFHSASSAGWLDDGAATLSLKLRGVADFYSRSIAGGKKMIREAEIRAATIVGVRLKHFNRCANATQVATARREKKFPTIEPAKHVDFSTTSACSDAREVKSKLSKTFTTHGKACGACLWNHLDR